MKKFISLFLVLALSLTLISCGEEAKKYILCAPQPI